MNFLQVKARLVKVREVGTEIVADPPHANRCAMAVGGALVIHPRPKDRAFSLSPDVKPTFANQPFVNRYFLKASELASAIEEKFGAPDAVLSGKQVLELRSKPPGVVYLYHCWHTGRQKVLSFLINIPNHLINTSPSEVIEPTGDHMDIWNGRALEIASAEYGQAAFRLVLQSKSVRYWQFLN